MPKLTIRFFGPARDIVGGSSMSLDVDEGDTVGSVAGRLAKEYPRLGAALGIRLAVNRAYVPLNHVLSEGDELAVIPPVSGGAPMPRARITHDPIDIGAVIAELQTNDAGAVVTFSGTVRAETQPREPACAKLQSRLVSSRSSRSEPLIALDYHAYDEMAVEQLEAVRVRALKQFDILDAAIVHRLGRLDVGVASIVIVVASTHREPGFDACRWIIDAVKTDVPIWKKDIWADGSQTWVDPTRKDSTQA